MSSNSIHGLGFDEKPQASAGRDVSPIEIGWRREMSGVRRFIERHVESEYALYGYGKLAFRDGLDLLAAAEDAGPRSNVVLPAYVPDGIVEPIREAGYEPRFHGISRDLRPKLSDVEALVDDETLAVLAVNYFGFPVDDLAALREIADEHGAAVVDDNAHAALSTTPDGRLLGTRGDVGFTSFRKTMPVPNGAALYLSDRVASTDALSRNGIRREYTIEDARYAANRVLDRLPDFASRGAGAIGTVTSRIVGDESADEPSVRDPEAIYERSKVPMSKLSLRVLEYVEPHPIVTARRRNYRARLSSIDAVEGVEAVYPTLPPGVCPQSFPVIAEDREILRQSVRPWPPLPEDVAADAGFETSKFLSKRLITLPV